MHPVILLCTCLHSTQNGNCRQELQLDVESTTSLTTLSLTGWGDVGYFPVLMFTQHMVHWKHPIPSSLTITLTLFPTYPFLHIYYLALAPTHKPGSLWLALALRRARGRNPIQLKVPVLGKGKTFSGQTVTWNSQQKTGFKYATLSCRYVKCNPAQLYIFSL